MFLYLYVLWCKVSVYLYFAGFIYSYIFHVSNVQVSAMFTRIDTLAALQFHAVSFWCARLNSMFRLALQLESRKSGPDVSNIHPNNMGTLFITSHLRTLSFLFHSQIRSCSLFLLLYRVNCLALKPCSLSVHLIVSLTNLCPFLPKLVGPFGWSGRRPFAAAKGWKGIIKASLLWWWERRLCCSESKNNNCFLCCRDHQIFYLCQNYSPIFLVCCNILNEKGFPILRIPFVSYTYIWLGIFDTTKD